jgi:hypothetical protein
MKDQTIRSALAIGLLGVVGLVGSGCVAPEKKSSVRYPTTTGHIVYMNRPVPAEVVAVQSQTVEDVGPTLSIPDPPTPVAATPPPSSPPQAKTVAAQPVDKPKAQPTKTLHPIPPPTASVAKPTPLPVPAVTTQPKPAAVPTPPSPATGHSPDYTWLNGEVQRYRLTKGWQLRYARLDEEDVHGGSVLLVGDTVHLDHLKEGQRVRVTGQIVPRESPSGGTSYHVDSLQVLTR